MTLPWTDHPVFTIDHAKMLADAILCINRRYLHELEQAAQVDNVERGLLSMRMIEIQHRWSDEIKQACENMLKCMSDTVNSSMKQCADILNTFPPRRTLIGLVKDHE